MGQNAFFALAGARPVNDQDATPAYAQRSEEPSVYGGCPSPAQCIFTECQGECRKNLELVAEASGHPDLEYPRDASGALEGHAPDQPRPSLPEDADKRNEYPMADGLLDYFPNALAEVARLSHRATQQHHPDHPMHWDRTKSRDHRNKIMRHLVDTHTVDDKGNDHWAMVCWRSLAGYQEYLEKKYGLPMSRASRGPVPA